MNLPFATRKEVIKRKRFNIHKYWAWLLSFLILGVTVEIGYLSWYFLHTTTVLDATPTPTLETNARQITRMKRNIEAIQKAIADRTGSTEAASQNTSQVIQ